eukprot:6464429-Amphidinium_carterae.1
MQISAAAGKLFGLHWKVSKFNGRSHRRGSRSLLHYQMGAGDSRERALAAVRCRGSALEELAENFRGDCEIVLTA